MFKERKFKSVYQEYLNSNLKLPRYKKLGVFFLAIVSAGFVGWFYECLVASIEHGGLALRGGNFLPWMNIYALGVLAVYPAVHRFRKKPLLVFLISSIVAGIVEYLGGWLIYTLGNGMRFWNYNHGLWAIGSINGFVCPLSMIYFGLLACFFVYLIIPLLIYLAQNLKKRTFLIISITLFSLVLIDEIANQTLTILGRPTARDFYSSLGLYMDKS